MGTTVFGSDFYYGYYGIDVASFSSVFLTASANLADVASVSNSRTNLGVPAMADIYTQTQLQTSGSSSVHWNNITNSVWTKPAANIVAGFDVDLSLNDFLNVGEMFSTNITNSAILTTQSIINSQWNSGQTGSIITVNSSTGQLDRLQTIYYADDIFNVEEEVNLSADVTIGTDENNLLTIYAAISADILVVGHTSGNAFISVMTNDTFVNNWASYNRHKSSLVSGVAIPLVVAHQSTDGGALTTGFGAGILFKGDIYAGASTDFAQISAILDTTTYLEFKAGSSGTLSSVLEVDYDEVRILEKLTVNPVNSGDHYIYNFPGDIIHIVSRTGSTSAVIDSLVVKTESSSAPGDGFGTSILFKVGQVTPTEADIARISARFDGGTTNSEIVLAPMISEVAQENLIIGATEINFAVDIIPITTGDYDIGSDGKRIDTVYTEWFRLGPAGSNKMIFNSSSANFDTHVLPITDNAYQLGDGASVLRWAEVHATQLGSLTYPVDTAYIGEVYIGEYGSSDEVGVLFVTQSTSGNFAAIFESNSGLNNGNNGILIRAGSSGAGGNNDVFIMFENQNGAIVGGIEWTGSAFAFFAGTTP